MRTILPVYALLFISFGLFGCAKKAPPPIMTPKKKVEKPAEEKPISPPPPKRVERKAPEPVSPPPRSLIEEEPIKPQRVPEVEFTKSYQTVFFEYDRSRLTSTARQILKENAELIRKDLRKHHEFKLLIEGHCDERGTNEYNLALGERRSFSARDYLISLGIPAGTLYTKSWGEEKPVVYGHDEDAWRKNRRAEFQISKGE